MRSEKGALGGKREESREKREERREKREERDKHDQDERVEGRNGSVLEWGDGTEKGRPTGNQLTRVQKCFSSTILRVSNNSNSIDRVSTTGRVHDRIGGRAGDRTGGGGYPEARSVAI